MRASQWYTWGMVTLVLAACFVLGLWLRSMLPELPPESLAAPHWPLWLSDASLILVRTVNGLAVVATLLILSGLNAKGPRDGAFIALVVGGHLFVLLVSCLALPSVGLSLLLFAPAVVTTGASRATRLAGLACGAMACLVNPALLAGLVAVAIASPRLGRPGLDSALNAGIILVVPLLLAMTTHADLSALEALLFGTGGGGGPLLSGINDAVTAGSQSLLFDLVAWGQPVQLAAMATSQSSHWFNPLSAIAILALIGMPLWRQATGQGTERGRLALLLLLSSLAAAAMPGSTLGNAPLALVAFALLSSEVAQMEWSTSWQRTARWLLPAALLIDSVKGLCVLTGG